LFGKDPLQLLPGCKVHFQRFEGEQERTGEQYNAVKDLFVEGTVPGIIQQVEKILESQLRTFSPLDANVKFFPIPEYPKTAWYEAVVNACVHRSYGNGMKNMPIFVKMFDDRLVIESPGPFPPFVTPSNIYESHVPRNPALMDAMFYLDYVKCAHEGTRRIRDTMATMNLPAPEFKQAASGPLVVTVTLRNNVKQRRAWVDRDVSKIISEAIAADLTEDERRALNFAAESGAITISDANKLLNVSWERARSILFGLARKRVFQYVRFRKFQKDVRDPKAFFRLRSASPLPQGGFEQEDLSQEEAE
jgi:ATP-dependent DNA helicase RecG